MKRLTSEDLAAAIEFARRGMVERTLLAMRTSIDDSMDTVLLNALTEIHELRERLAAARAASSAIGERVLEMAHDPGSASRAFAVGVALRKLDDALGVETLGETIGVER